MKPVRSVLENLGKTDFEGLKLKLEQNMYLWELISSAGAATGQGHTKRHWLPFE
jgi:hypothetical protein